MIKLNDELVNMSICVLSVCPHLCSLSLGMVVFNRWPTDILCLALFVAFVIVLFAIGIYCELNDVPCKS